MKNLMTGLLLAVASFSAQAAVNLVSNGNFETGSFSGWTKSGNPSLSDVIANNVTTNHTFLWRSGATGSQASISQNLTTVAGGLYNLSFDLYSAGTNNVSFDAYFNGTKVYSLVNQALSSWTHFSFDNLAATGPVTELKFSSRNDPSFTRLDNVSVTLLAPPVPEPETYAMLAVGLGLMGFAARRRQQ